MSEQRTSNEPSMEEILASIRRIISEDSEAPGQEGRPATPASPGDPAEAARPAAPVGSVGADVAPERGGPGADPVPAGAAAWPPATDAGSASPVARVDDDDDVFQLDEIAPAEALGGGGAQDDILDLTELAPEQPGLGNGHALATPVGALPLGNGSATLEQMVREMLRPMLQEWLDRHLPGIVEQEVRRIRGSGSGS